MPDVKMCKRGLHEITPANLISAGNGRSSCRACYNTARRARRGNCSVGGCTNSATSGSLCTTHSDRLRKHGSIDWQPMTPAEIADEVRWLMSGGMNAWETAASLKKTPSALAIMLYRLGEDDLANRFEDLRRKIA